MNLYLIGYRCTGKTRVGKRLAQKLGWRFVDSDQRIENRAGMRISDIVAQFGWPGFRKRETDAVTEIGREDQSVVATGGGIVLDPKNVDVLLQTGIVVWLKADAKTIITRMRTDPETEATRPALTLLSPKNEISETLAQRYPLYEKASHLQVDTDGCGVEHVCHQIIDKLRCFDAGKYIWPDV